MRAMLFRAAVLVTALAVVAYFILLKDTTTTTTTGRDGGEAERRGGLPHTEEPPSEVESAVIPSLRPVLESRKKLDFKSSLHLSVVVCGDRLEETIVLLKSAILLSRRPLVFHLFVEDALQEKCKEQLDFWPEEFQRRMHYRIFSISYPVNEQEWKKLFKPCASQRIFIPDILSDVDSLLYVDTDVLFLRPLDDIWQFFERFTIIQHTALAPEHEDKATGWYNRFARHPYFGPLGLNSGVMLMNLTRMRQSTWLSSLMQYYEEYKLKIPWGDQDLINIYFHFHADELYVYPCQWNYRPDHCMYMSVCHPAETEGVSVVHGCRRVMHTDKQPAFKAVYSAFKEHRLGDDLEVGLLDSMKRHLAETVNTNCGKLGFAFTKQLEEQIKLLKNKH